MLISRAKRGNPPQRRPSVTARSERVQLAFAGLLWWMGAAVLAVRAIEWLSSVPYALAYAVAGVVVGVAKAHFILAPVARKAASRIRERGAHAPIAGFFSLRSWAVVLGMVGFGHALRLTEIPQPLLAAVYFAVSTALVVASRVFWRFHIEGWDRDGDGPVVARVRRR